MENVCECSRALETGKKGRKSKCALQLQHYCDYFIYVNGTFELDILVEIRAARKKHAKLLQSHTDRKNIRILA